LQRPDLQAADGDHVIVGNAHVAASLTEMGGNFNDAVLSVYNEHNDGDGLVAFLATTYQRPPFATAIWGKNGRTSGVGIGGEANELGGVGVRGNARGEGGIAFLGAANGFGGVGMRTDSSLAGVIGVVPAGRQAGPGIWGVSGTGFADVDITNLHAGVLGTADTVGVAGVPAGADLGGVRLVPGKSGIVGIAAGVSSRGVLATASGLASVGVDGSGPLGILGTADPTEGVGVRGAAGPEGLGVNGIGGIGVLGQGVAATNVGVVGAGGADGVGVMGLGSGAEGIAVRADNADGIGLSVEGRSQFSQVRRGAFEVGKRVAVVQGLKISASSGVVATLNTSPGPGSHLLMARANPNTGRVRLTLTAPAKRPAKFTVFVVDEAVQASVGRPAVLDQDHP
jgi:hypothetical protein